MYRIGLVKLALMALTCGLARAESPRLSFYGLQSHAAVTSILTGEKFVVKFTNLLPSKLYLIRAQMSFRGHLYQSEIEARANSWGSLQTDTLEPLRGSYRGRDSDGLIWSMRKVAGNTGDIPEWTYRFSLVDKASSLVSGDLPISTYGNQALYEVPLAGSGLVGNFLIPDQKRRPVVIILGGSEGYFVQTAAYLASQGFAALGLAYFGRPGVPQKLSHIPVEYIKQAIDYLRASPYVDATKIGIWGWSRGAELALLAASHYPAFNAVVTEATSGVVWGTPQGSAWTLAGKDLPYLIPQLGMVSAKNGRRVYEAGPVRAQTIQSTRDRNFLIPLHKIQAPLLVLAGADDQVMPLAPLRKLFADLQNTTRSYFDRMIVYSDVGHNFIAFPGLPADESWFVDQGPNSILAGGTVAANAAAQRDRLDKIVEFFRSALR